MPHHHPPSLPELVDAERVDALLTPWVPDADDRAFVVRNMLAEGPAHHRIANYTLLVLLGEVLAAAGGGARPDGAEVSVPMRLPPRRDARSALFPAGLPTRVLSRVAPDAAAHAEVVDALLDGPSHHALANAAMIDLLDRILASLEK